MSSTLLNHLPNSWCRMSHKDAAANALSIANELYFISRNGTSKSVLIERLKVINYLSNANAAKEIVYICTDVHIPNKEYFVKKIQELIDSANDCIKIEGGFYKWINKLNKITDFEKIPRFIVNEIFGQADKKKLSKELVGRLIYLSYLRTEVIMTEKILSSIKEFDFDLELTKGDAQIILSENWNKMRSVSNRWMRTFKPVTVERVMSEDDLNNCVIEKYRL